MSRRRVLFARDNEGLPPSPFHGRHEVQREPGLLRTVKRAIARNRTPGRFLVTGSATICR